MSNKPQFQFSWGNYQGTETFENNIETIGHDNPWRSMSNVIQVSKANNIRAYHSLEDFEKDKERGRMFLDEQEYLTFIKSMEKALGAAWSTYKELRSLDMKTLSSEQLYELFERLHVHYRHSIAHFYATQPEGIQILIAEIEKHVSPDELGILLSPKELDVANQESIAWYELTLKPYAEDSILEHAFAYPWTVSAHFTFSDVIATLKARYDHDKGQLPRPTIEAEKKETGDKQITILDRNPEIRDLVRRAQRLALSRMEIKAAFSAIDFYSIPLVSQIAERCGENPLDIHLYYLLQNGKELIFDGNKLTEEAKAARKRCFVAAIEDGVIVYKEGEEAEIYALERLGALYDEGVTAEVTELRGNTAVKGKVTGIVRVLHANDMVRARELRETFKKGDILVTEMTQPNIIDIAARAGAIVTDEGSLLSHAAIISREFGIPCVIYTRMATKVLKDGDTVEVDANAGIVRILKKAMEIETRKLELFGYRDFTLALSAMWTEAESEPLLYLENYELSRPYSVLERKNGVCGYFDDFVQVRWLKKQIYERIVHDERFASYLIEHSREYYVKIIEVLEKKESVERDTLHQFSSDLKEMCRWSTGWWWAMDVLEEKQTHVHVLKELMDFRKECESFFPDADHIFRISFKKLYPDLTQYADVLLIREVVTDSIPAEEILRERLNSYLFVNDAIYIGDDITKTKHDLNFELVVPKSDLEYQEGSTLTGQIAEKGKYTGEVRIVFTKDDAGKFPEGHVLVAGQTTPDFMTAIAKCGAIVTDEGGLLTHAAIVSRELKKPCIIGTKFATQALRNGDIVEVDADRGVVKMLKRAPVQSPTTSIFKKEVTRDLSLMVVERLGPALKNLYEKLKGERPLSPFLILHVKDLLVEEWLDSALTEELTELIYVKNQEGSQLLEEGIAQYEHHLAIYKDAIPSSPDELQVFTDSLERAFEGFLFFYFTAGDPRTPKPLLKRASDVRDKDTIGDTSDRIVRSALESIFPHTVGYETVISSEDIENMPLLSTLKERAPHFLFVLGRFSLITKLDDFLDRHPEFRFNIEPVPPTNSSIRGQTGSKGHAKGIVRILIRKKDIGSLLEGEILVSTMTTPDFVPAMKKAAAIVTDEGGITCHAAIVAREMKKPCIIGTKFATQLLKTGDLIEVDATLGIIKILERAKMQ